jgi:predicted ATPase
LDLINSLVKGICEEEFDHEEEPKSTRIEPSHRHMLFLGCYRSNEVTPSHPLATCIQRMEDCGTIAVQDIHLEGLPRDALNAWVSDSLFYPQRLTRPLADLIHQKTAGNPLHAKEFLNSLATENLLPYSLYKHMWHFDEELIQLKTVSDGVADLLTLRLQRLPGAVLSGLQVRGQVPCCSAVRDQE